MDESFFLGVDGWLTPNEGHELQRLANEAHVLEIGSFKGRSTCAMLPTCKSITCLDHFMGDGYTNQVDPLLVRNEFFHNMERIGADDRLTVMVGDFRHSLSLLEGAEFDLVFYDADHTGEATRLALSWTLSRKWLDKCVVAVHDYDDSYPHYREAKNAIDMFAVAVNRRIDLTDKLAVM